MILTIDQREELEEILKPVMDFLSNSEVFHPYVKIIVDNQRAEIVEGVANIVTAEERGEG